jgi:hypothetical protein
MSESNKPFTVKDRRHFTPEGGVREEAESPDAPDSANEAPAVPPAPEEETPSGAPPVVDPPAPDHPEGADAAAPPPPETAAESPSSGPTAPGGPDAGPADFGQFLFSLGAQAGMLLSGQGLPEGADPGEALAGARSIISILEMLKEKTEGRRTAQEEEILEGLLFELRMAYVEKSRAGGS